jgi:hypothetical protein
MTQIPSGAVIEDLRGPRERDGGAVLLRETSAAGCEQRLELRVGERYILPGELAEDSHETDPDQLARSRSRWAVWLPRQYSCPHFVHRNFPDAEVLTAARANALDGSTGTSAPLHNVHRVN